MNHFKYSLSELNDMLPWEREVYIELLTKHLDEQKSKNEGMA